MNSLNNNLQKAQYLEVQKDYESITNPSIENCDNNSIKKKVTSLRDLEKDSEFLEMRNNLRNDSASYELHNFRNFKLSQLKKSKK